MDEPSLICFASVSSVRHNGHENLRRIELVIPFFNALWTTLVLPLKGFPPTLRQNQKNNAKPHIRSALLLSVASVLPLPRLGSCGSNQDHDIETIIAMLSHIFLVLSAAAGGRFFPRLRVVKPPDTDHLLIRRPEHDITQSPLQVAPDIYNSAAASGAQ